jgi:hypothetical protein
VEGKSEGGVDALVSIFRLPTYKPQSALDNSPHNIREGIYIFIHAHFYQRTVSTYCKLSATRTVSTKSGTALLVLLVPWYVHARVHLEEVMRAETDTNMFNRHTEKYTSGTFGEKE